MQVLETNEYISLDSEKCLNQLNFYDRIDLNKNDNILYCKRLDQLDPKDIDFLKYLSNHFILSFNNCIKIYNTDLVNKNPNYWPSYIWTQEYGYLYLKNNWYMWKNIRILDYIKTHDYEIDKGNQYYEYGAYTFANFIDITNLEYEIIDNPLDKENSFVCLYKEKCIRYNNTIEFNKTIEGYFNCFEKLIEIYLNE